MDILLEIYPFLVFHHPHYQHLLPICLPFSPTTLSLCRQLKCPELDLSQLPFLSLCTSEEWFLKSGCRVADVEAGAASGGWWQVAQVGGGEQVSRRWQHRQTSEEGSTWSEEAGAAVASCPSLSMAATTLVKPPPPSDMHAHTFMQTLNQLFRCNFALQLVTYKLAFINVLATRG